MTNVWPIAAIAVLASGAAFAQDDTDALVSRGEYLVTIGSCNDCHTPFIMGPDGPEPDMSRRLSGHPADIVIEGPGELPEPWTTAFSATNTAFSGPWGVSFSANLTPDPETGVLADVSEEQFIEALRNGRHQGQGRPILPPMPWPFIGQMTDDDLRAVYAYLNQLEPITNDVPDPIEAQQ